MKLDWSIAAGMGLAVALAIVATWGGRHFKGAELLIFGTVVALVAIVAASALIYFKNRGKKAAKPAAAGGAPADAGGTSEIDVLVREADQRLARANAGATIANMPLIFVIGDKATAKTSTIVNSGIEPEHLAGNLFLDNNVIAPTRAANLWFARGTALVEAGGPILGDPANWMKLVKRLQPGKMKSLKGGAQSPRAVLLCVSLEAFMQQGGADAMTAAARYLQARLAEIAQTLGIRFPVYILFTKTDRVPFFTEFVGTFNNDEAGQVFGVTVPIRPPQQTGVYADDETRRLTSYYDNLFYSLCDKRTVFPPRDNDVEKICGAYEFPREMRKLRDLVVRFMVDANRPSQLTTSPFLRGFYFSGVRPVTVSDAAPMVAASRPRESEYQDPNASSATGMFRVGKKQEIVAQQSMAQSGPTSRKVPQWMFLGNLFNGIILGDSAAMSASGSSVKVSALRRGLLIAASVACLIFSGIFLWSYLGNRALEQEALKAAKSIKTDPLPAKELPTLSSLEQLEVLRKNLETLNGYEYDYTPISLRWGLYKGSDMLPEVQRLYFERFKALLFGQTQTGLLKIMQGVKSPPGPNDEYKYPYDTLKGYLLTTSEYKRTAPTPDPVKKEPDTSLRDFLGNLLLTRWSQNREADIGKPRMDLARTQFDYYAKTMSGGLNPYSDKSDVDAVKGTRIYLAGFVGPQRVYVALLGDTDKQGKPISFNQYAEGSAAVLLSAYPVKFAYTKPGSKFMLEQIGKANFGGEKWVLGDYAKQSEDTATMQKGVTDLFIKDFIHQWRTVLGTSKVVPYTDPKDASKKLSTLTSSTAPILALFAWASQNTSIELQPVKDAFKAVHTVEPPTNPAYVAPPVLLYNQSLQTLQAAIEKWVEGGADPAMLGPWREAADAARKETRNVSAQLPPDPEAHLQATIEDLMLKPIIEADRMIPKPGAELNKAGAGFCNAFGPLTLKFPFQKGADDNWRKNHGLTLNELDSIFKPDTGKMWEFAKALSKVMDCSGADCKVVDKPPFPINPDFVNFFSQAVKFSHAFYGPNGGPAMQYSLRPKKAAEWPESYEVEVNGDMWKTPGDESKSYVWNGAGAKQNFVLTLKPGPPSPAESFDGTWAVFRFLAQGVKVGGNEYRLSYHNPNQGSNAPPVTYTFTVETSAPIFSNYLTRCEPTVVK